MAPPTHPINTTSLAGLDLRNQHPRAFEIDEDPWIITSDAREGFAWLANERQDHCLTAHVAVRPGYLRKGIGSSLLKRLLEHAREKGASSIISAHGIPIPAEGSFSTPSPTVRFCRHHGFKERDHLDTFHLDDEDALRLINRLGRTHDRITPSSIYWRFANDVETSTLAGFIESHIHLNVRGATPLLKSGKFFAELSPVAFSPDGQIAGLAIVGRHPQLRNRLEYFYLATDPQYRQSALMPAILYRSIQKGWEIGWRCSEFRVRREDSAAMWRFAQKNGKWISQLAHFWREL